MPTVVQSETDGSSKKYRENIALDDNVNEKLVKLNIAENDSSNSSDRKMRERNVKIARGHQIFRNIESTLCDAQLERKSIEQGKKEQRINSRLESWEIASPSRSSSSELLKPLYSRAVTVDELVRLFDLAVDDQHAMFDKLKRALDNGDLALSEDEWDRFACHISNAGVRGARFAVAVAVIAVRQKSFRSAFAQQINMLMSNHVLYEGKAKEGVPEFIALLLVTNWPREHARSDLESNAILFYIVSSIKGWLITITGEADEVEEVESNCACALYEVCRFAQRKLWLKWPELVDECYVAVRNAMTSNITLTKIARKALLDTLIMMHEWISRNAKTLVNASTQTLGTQVQF